jgi:hypothetical protein
LDSLSDRIFNESKKSSVKPTKPATPAPKAAELVESINFVTVLESEQAQKQAARANLLEFGVERLPPR